MQEIVKALKESAKVIHAWSKGFLGLIAILAIVVGLPLSLVASQTIQSYQQHAAENQTIKLPEGSKLVFTIHVNGLTPGNPAVFYITSSSTHTEPIKATEPTKPPKVEPNTSSGDNKNPTQVKGDSIQPNDGGNEGKPVHSEPIITKSEPTIFSHEPSASSEVKDFIPSQVYTTGDNGDIVLSVNPSDHLTITPLSSKGYSSISPTSMNIYVLQTTCGISSPCIFNATAIPTDQHITPTPLKCVPRPFCLDGNPRCMIAEPAEGWCPKPSITPQPEITSSEIKCPQLSSTCRYLGTGECVKSSSSSVCSCGEVVCNGL